VIRMSKTFTLALAGACLGAGSSFTTHHIPATPMRDLRVLNPFESDRRLNDDGGEQRLEVPIRASRQLSWNPLTCWMRQQIVALADSD
jgi:hypothetical protein